MVDGCVADCAEAVERVVSVADGCVADCVEAAACRWRSRRRAEGKGEAAEAEAARRDRQWPWPIWGEDLRVKKQGVDMEPDTQGWEGRFTRGVEKSTTNFLSPLHSF
jgi:hypothetical protein